MATVGYQSLEYSLHRPSREKKGGVRVRSKKDGIGGLALGGAGGMKWSETLGGTFSFQFWRIFFFTNRQTPRVVREGISFMHESYKFIYCRVWFFFWASSVFSSIPLHSDALLWTDDGWKNERPKFDSVILLQIWSTRTILGPRVWGPGACWPLEMITHNFFGLPLAQYTCSRQ